jgi:multicomponent Na+:H+ antiporter subunit C
MMLMPPDPLVLLAVGAVGLIAIGAAGLALSRHLLRLVLALGIAEAGANLLLVIAGYRWDAVAPILTGQAATAAMVDPLPQALVLTAIVIGVGVQALAVALLVRVKSAYGTLDMAELKRLMERDISTAAGVAPPQSQHLPGVALPAPVAVPLAASEEGA